MAKVTKRAWGESIPNRDEQFEQKRQVVLRTAARTYSKRGFHETTLADIAEELHISKPTLYYYFKSKDDILFECHRIAVEAITDGDTPMPTADQMNARDRLVEFVRRYVLMVLDDFGTCLVMTSKNTLEPENRGIVIEGRRRIDTMLREILDAGAKDGTFQCPDPKLSAMFIFGAMNWIPYWFHLDGELSVDDLTKRLTDFAMQAVAKPQAFAP